MNTSLLWFVQVFVFILGSVILIYVSRKPLRHPRSHGFYRFFAWEAILALAAINLPAWFRDPFSISQLISWLLLVAAAFLVINGVLLLRRIGRPGQIVAAKRSNSDANFALENTSHLVREGVYRWIRHPLYASLLYLAWGVYLKQPTSLLGCGLALLASGFLWLTARADEEECKGFFGQAYLDYMKRTRMFIPFLF